MERMIRQLTSGCWWAGLAGKGRGGVVVKQVPKESFFNFFAAMELPDEDAVDEEEVRAEPLAVLV